MAKKITARTQIKEAAKELKELMRDNLEPIAEDMISRLMGSVRRLTPSQRAGASKDLEPVGVRDYKALMLEALSSLALDGINQARKEVPKAKKVQLADFDKLPPALQKKIKARNDLLVGKQIADLTRVIQFAYENNEDTTDSDDQVEQDLHDSALGWLDGTALSAGADITASTVINSAREAFFFDDETLKEIDAFEFVNGDPVTEVCQDLAGTVFAKDDPNMFRYTPPLHWNCKSYIVPILAGDLGNKEIEVLKPSTKKIEDTIQFSEENHLFCCVNEKLC